MTTTYARIAELEDEQRQADKARAQKWEPVQFGKDRYTDRLPVPGGWIYTVQDFDPAADVVLHMSVVFVAAPQTEPLAGYELAVAKAALKTGVAPAVVRSVLEQAAAATSPLVCYSEEPEHDPIGVFVFELARQAAAAGIDRRLLKLAVRRARYVCQADDAMGRDAPKRAVGPRERLRDLAQKPK